MTAETAVQRLRSGGEVNFGAFIACAEGWKIPNDMADLFADFGLAGAYRFNILLIKHDVIGPPR